MPVHPHRGKASDSLPAEAKTIRADSCPSLPSKDPDATCHEGRAVKTYLVAIISLFFFINSTASSYECDNSTEHDAFSSDDFYEFSIIFINNPYFQKKFSNDHIIISLIDIESYLIPHKIHKSIDKNDIKYPIIPSFDIINEDKQKLKIVQTDKNNAEIIRSKDDTGLLIKYHFKKYKCWNLYMIEDDSI
jgi:hypothetical protein